ncbi:MAG: DUF4040 domain-containing protein [Anaerolineales bacterium]|nr:DUF4040 domain-containing protein [Anaerolineales bacterium]
MQTFIILVLVIAFAIQAIHSKHLINSALWLAAVSALLSVVFYLLGGTQVAMIELSVGAGLVTILFVFVINIAGDEVVEGPPVIPRLLAFVTVLLNALLFFFFVTPLDIFTKQGAEPPFAILLWQQRGLDVLVQIVLIFAGVLGLLGLLAESKAPLEQPLAGEVSERRERELNALEIARSQKEKELTL